MSKKPETLEVCVKKMKDFYSKHKGLNANVLMIGIDSLEKLEHIKAYAKELVEIVKQNLKEHGKVPKKQIATKVAYAHLRRVINHYNNTTVHERWNKALPGLNTSGGFSTFL